MRSKIVLLLAVVMGIITTALFFQYMKQFDAEKTAAAKVVEIVVAKDKIEKNEKITSDKLEMIAVTENSVLPQSIRSIDLAEGKLAESMIEKGEPILTHRLISQKEEATYVSRKVREGYRAVSVSVNITQSVSNLIEPEDEVDVIHSKENKKAPEQPAVDSVILLEKARVLAVGRKMILPENTKEPYVEYSSITLELKPEDALKLVNSSEIGKIHFILYKRPVITDKNEEETDGEG